MHKIVQLIGLAIVIVSAIVFFVTLSLHWDELNDGTNVPAALTLTGSFLAGIAGIGVFMVGRLMAWWKRP